MPAMKYRAFAIGLLHGQTAAIALTTPALLDDRASTTVSHSYITSAPSLADADLRKRRYSYDRGYGSDVCGYPYKSSTLLTDIVIKCESEHAICKLNSMYNVVHCCDPTRQLCDPVYDYYGGFYAYGADPYPPQLAYACQPHTPHQFNPTVASGTTYCGSFAPLCATLTWTDIGASAVQCQKADTIPTTTVAGDFRSTDLNYHVPPDHYHHQDHASASSSSGGYDSGTSYSSYQGPALGKLIGGVLGGVLGGIASLVAGCCYYRKRKKQGSPPTNVSQHSGATHQPSKTPQTTTLQPIASSPDVHSSRLPAQSPTSAVQSPTPAMQSSFSPIVPTIEIDPDSRPPVSAPAQQRPNPPRPQREMPVFY